MEDVQGLYMNYKVPPELTILYPRNYRVSQNIFWWYISPHEIASMKLSNQIYVEL